MPSKPIPGRIEDYAKSTWASGIILRSPLNQFILNNGTEIQFEATKRDYRVQGSELIAMDGPIGNASGASAPCPNCAAVNAKLAKAKADLQAIVNGL